MIKFHAGMNGFFLLVICSLGLFSPTESFANLNSIACGAVWRGCRQGCDTSSCIEACDGAHVSCLVAGLKKKQGAPQPCTGVRCSLPTHNPHPPTTVSDPTPPSHGPVKPVEPVKPVGVSNPNQTNSGTNGSGGSQEHGHK